MITCVAYDSLFGESGGTIWGEFLGAGLLSGVFSGIRIALVSNGASLNFALVRLSA